MFIAASLSSRAINGGPAAREGERWNNPNASGVRENHNLGFTFHREAGRVRALRGGAGSPEGRGAAGRPAGKPRHGRGAGAALLWRHLAAQRGGAGPWRSRVTALPPPPRPGTAPARREGVWETRGRAAELRRRLTLSGGLMAADSAAWAYRGEWVSPRGGGTGHLRANRCHKPSPAAEPAAGTDHPGPHLDLGIRPKKMPAGVWVPLLALAAHCGTRCQTSSGLWGPGLWGPGGGNQDGSPLPLASWQEWGHLRDKGGSGQGRRTAAGERPVARKSWAPSAPGCPSARDNRLRGEAGGRVRPPPCSAINSRRSHQEVERKAIRCHSLEGFFQNLSCQAKRMKNRGEKKSSAFTSLFPRISIHNLELISGIQELCFLVLPKWYFAVGKIWGLFSTWTEAEAAKGVV